MRYQSVDLLHRSSHLLSSVFAAGKKISAHPLNPVSHTIAGRFSKAYFESLERLTKRYDKPGFKIERTEIKGESVEVCEEVIMSKPFCDLVHFKREGIKKGQPKILVVAALSGHYASLVKGTIQSFLPDHEVYVTDWNNARDVPLSDGRWGFDDYVTYLIEFIEEMGTDVHLMGLCQGTIPSLVASAVMNQSNSKFLPKTLTLMAGPVDCRVNPGVVNQYAADLSADWFRDAMIMSVPFGYAGEDRRVYPGFIQLNAFMALNPNLHVKKHGRFFKDVLFGNAEEAEQHRDFYDEYMAVLDSTEEFYIETLERVFFNFDIPNGTLKYQGKLVDFSAIKKIALMTVEGEKDEMCTLGQTQAAHDVLAGVPNEMREHYVQQGVGHYGVFTGSLFRKGIAPHVKTFIAKHA